MIIFLYGPDSYRRQEKLNEYIDRYKIKFISGAGFFYLDKNEDWARFKDFCKSQSLFESSKLGVVSNFGELGAIDIKEFIVLIKNNLKNKDLTLIINSEKKPIKEFNFLLKEPVMAHNFEYLDVNKINKFLNIEIKKRGLILDNESADLILRSCGQNTQEIVSELDKLALLDEKKVSKKILEKYIDLLPTVDVFSHLNQIRASYSAGSRLALLEELFSGGVDPAMIFNLAAASPYLNQEQKIKMADYDAAVKSGKLEYEEVLTEMMLD